MKTTARIMTFKLSVLTLSMLCVTANNASDIEIYKAPNAADGKARVMLNLDNSTSMSGDPSGMKGGLVQSVMTSLVWSVQRVIKNIMSTLKHVPTVQNPIPIVRFIVRCQKLLMMV